jgi:predicted transcriptional regulator
VKEMQTESELTLEETHRPHRSRIEMRAAILRAVRSETSPTRIMRRANLSWNLLSGFLPGLVAKRLVRESASSDRKSYALTTRGNDVLRLFDLVRQELSEPGDSKAWTMDADETIRSTDDFFAELDRLDKVASRPASARLTAPAATA